MQELFYFFLLRTLQLYELHTAVIARGQHPRQSGSAPLTQTGQDQLIHLAGSCKTVGYSLAGITNANYQNTSSQLLPPGLDVLFNLCDFSNSFLCHPISSKVSRYIVTVSDFKYPLDALVYAGYLLLAAFMTYAA